jgi:hypothetical protein
MKRFRILVLLLGAFGVSLPLLSMASSQSRMECPAGACWSNDDCSDGAECFFPVPGGCGVCEF